MKLDMAMTDAATLGFAMRVQNEMFAENARLREALEAAVEALGHIPDMRGCLHEAWFSSPEDAPSASSAEREVKAIEIACSDALAKVRAALGRTE